jgi:hypothetical protein
MALDLLFPPGSDGLHFPTNEQSSTYDGESLDTQQESEQF